MGEEVAVDGVLAAGGVLLGGAEVLEGAEAGDAVEGPEALAGDGPRVVKTDVEAVAATGLGLRGREGDADAVGGSLADEVEERTPATAEVEDPPARLDPDLLADVLVLPPLGLLEGQGEVAVVFGAAEVSQLAEAETEDAVDQRVGEVEVSAVGDPETVDDLEPISHSALVGRLTGTAGTDGEARPEWEAR